MDSVIPHSVHTKFWVDLLIGGLSSPEIQRASAFQGSHRVMSGNAIFRSVLVSFTYILALVHTVTYRFIFVKKYCTLSYILVDKYNKILPRALKTTEHL